jgi:diguanylate cyclase (GGDEF)-like protein/PAS domain S-box-containing protein
VPSLLTTHRPSALPLSRMRGLSVVAATASAVLALARADLSSEPAALRLLATLTTLALCGHWILGWRRGRFPVAAEPLEAAALLLLLRLSPGDPFVPLFGLVFRSLYGGPAIAAVRYGMWVAALLVGHAPRGGVQLHADLARALGLGLVPVIVHLLSSTLGRLEASERRLASLVRNSTDVVTVVGEDLVVRWQAGSILGVLGYEHGAVRGTSLLDLVHPDDHATLSRCVAEAQPLDGASTRLELRLRHADGRYRHFEVALSNRLHDPSVGGIVLNMRDATERLRLEQELRALAAQREYDALHDPLTGLANRRKLFAELAGSIEHAASDAGALALLIIDLDGFKELNDTLGHQAGDELLAAIRPRLTTGAPGAQLVARLGGDEFAVLLGAGTTLAEATRIAGLLRDAIEQPFRVRGLTVRVRGSVGIAMYPEHGTDVATLVQRADIAMYCAKDKGLGHAVYDATSNEYSTERLSLMGELPEAIACDQLVVVYQPKVDLRTGEITGAEALVRWNHPVHGMLTPDVFLALVEQTGLMPALTLKVLDRALAQCATWRDHGLQLGIAVNLAAPNLVDIGFPDEVARLLLAHGVDAEALTLEVTETIVAADPPRVIDVMTRLRDLGMTLSLDDFGTGSSSLSFLRRLPVQELKIDKSFVLGMTDHPQDAAIVRTITQLAHDLGIAVVAEGIETPDVYERLRRYGCDAGQGFHLGRPMHADALTRLADGRHAAV